MVNQARKLKTKKKEPNLQIEYCAVRWFHGDDVLDDVNTRQYFVNTLFSGNITKKNGYVSVNEF